MTEERSPDPFFPRATWAKLFPGVATPEKISDVWPAGGYLPQDWKAWEKPADGAIFPKVDIDDRIEVLISGRLAKTVRQRCADEGFSCPFYAARIFLINALYDRAFEHLYDDLNSYRVMNLSRAIADMDALSSALTGASEAASKFMSDPIAGIVDDLFMQRSYLKKLDERLALDKMFAFLSMEKRISREVAPISDRFHVIIELLSKERAFLAKELKAAKSDGKTLRFERVFIKRCGEFWHLITGQRPGSNVVTPGYKFISGCYSSADTEDLPGYREEFDIENQIRRLSHAADNGPEWDGWQRLSGSQPIDQMDAELIAAYSSKVARISRVNISEMMRGLYKFRPRRSEILQAMGWPSVTPEGKAGLASGTAARRAQMVLNSLLQSAVDKKTGMRSRRSHHRRMSKPQV